jgi:hypothetical protein
VWLRTALLLILWLLVFRILMGVFRRLSEGRRGGRSTEIPPEREREPGWSASDVIDVPFQELPAKTTPERDEPLRRERP